MPQTICLVMIATNEEDFILDALLSVVHHIHHAVIVDSGNTDKTREVAAKFLAEHNIPVDFHYHKFKSGGDQRTYALRKSKGICNYRLLMDADNTLEVTLAFDDRLQPLTHDAYSIEKVCGGINYGGIIALVRSDQDWMYEGVIHEYATRVGGEPFTCMALPGCRIHEAIKEDGPRKRSPEHYYAHALLLENELFYNKDLPAHLVSRYWFYLGQSYRDAGQPERAIAAYKMRTMLTAGFVEELYVSYLWIGRLGNLPGYFRKAWDVRPARLEAAYELVKLHADEGLYNLATIIGAASMALQPCKDLLFLETDLYQGKFKELLDFVMEKKKFL